MKKLLRILFILVLLGGGFLTLIKNPQRPISQTVMTTLGLTIDITTETDTASTYCEQQSGTVEDLGNYRLCHFPDGNICETWAFMNGFCKDSVHVGILNSSSYFISGDAVYFLQVNNIKSQISGADTTTFVPVSDIYAKDKNHVYYGINIMASADPQTFEVVMSGDRFIGKDKNDIYRDSMNSAEYEQIQKEKADAPSEAERKRYADDTTLIRQYYEAIQNKDFTTAASLSADSTTTAASLSAKYGNADKIIPYEIIGKIKDNDGIYTIYIYYTEKSSNASTTYEVIKQIVDGNLKNISSKVRPTVVPTEFSLSDSKYKIYQLTPINVFSRFKYEGGDRSEFDELIGSSDTECLFNPQDPSITSQKKYQDKLDYFRKLFAKYDAGDIMNVYLITDPTLIYGKTKDSGLVEEAGE